MVESTAPSYEISFENKKHFTPTEITDMQHAFKLYDSDKNGTMNAAEFKQVLVDLGKRDVTDEQVKKMLSEVDKNNDSVIQWNEFVEMFKQLKVNNQDLFSKVLTTKAGEMSQHTSESGFTHSYLVEEKICFAKLVNEFLNGDDDVKDIVPLNPENDDLFHSMESGIVLSKLVNIAVENTIDFRALNKKPTNVYQVKENLNLAINACKGIGIKLPGINTQAFIEKKHHLILAALW